MMTVKEWMTPDPKTIAEDDVVRTAVMLVLQNRIRHLPVLRAGALVGIISDRDLKRSMPSVVAGATEKEYRAFMDNTPIKELMTINPITCSETTPLVELVAQFCEHKVGAIPVVDGERLVGIVTQTDMMHAFLKVLKES
jgi:acetoin utilization protein AcuB